VTAPYLYAIALGSNRRHGRYGAPVTVLAAAIAALESDGFELFAASPVITSAPIGPSQRRFANAAIVIATPLMPPDVLARLKRIERDFGRRRGQRWGARVLDLDLIFWSGGVWADQLLTIPHPRWASRRFVVDPLMAIASDWRGPLTHLSIRHAAARLARAKPTVDPSPRFP
jgi:2-amino-4-hydroxy-6-hydroxymethyldihydropteridine diphosphokinase